MDSSSLKPKHLLWMILALAVLLNLWGSSWSLPHLYHPDESYTVSHALKMAEARSLNPQWFLYPSLTLYVYLFLYGLFYAVGSLAGVFPDSAAFRGLYFTDPSLFYLLARISSGLFVVGAVWLTFRLGERLYDKATGLGAAVLASLSVPLLFVGHLAKPDALNLFLTLLAVFLMARLKDRNCLRDYVWCGLAAGLSASAKYHGIFLIGGLIAAPLILKPRRTLKDFLEPRILAALTAFPLGFLIGTPYALLDHSGFKSDWAWRSQQIGEGVQGMQYLFCEVASFYPLSIVLLLGILPALFFVVGIARLFVQRDRKDLFLAVLIGGLYVMLCLFPYYSPYYLVPVFPLVLLLAVRGVFWLPRRSWRTAFLSLLIAESLLSAGSFGLILSRPDTRTEAREWFEETIPAESSAAVDPRGIQLPHTRASLLARYEAVDQTPQGRDAWTLARPDEEYSSPAYNIWEIQLDQDVLRELRKRGAAYVVTSSFHGDRFMLFAPMRRGEPTAAREYERLQSFLEEEGGVLAVFDPYRDSSRRSSWDWAFNFSLPGAYLFNHVQPGPLLVIYKIPPAP